VFSRYVVGSQSYWHCTKWGGAIIKLVFLDVEPLQLESGVRSQVVKIGGQAEFTCSAIGLPTPTVKWLVKGVQQSSGVSISNVVFRNTTIKATSSFSMSAIPESKTGQVTCVAVHERDGELESVASTANLVVLSESTSNHTYCTMGM